MPSLRSFLVRSLLVRGILKPMFNPEKQSIEQIRKKISKMAGRAEIAPAVHTDIIETDMFRAEWITARTIRENNPQVIFYVHSGGFCLGLNQNHRSLAARLSQITGLKVFAVDYRLAPECPYPAAIDDCLAAFRWLSSSGISPNNIVLWGDSAGAGLALLLLLELRDLGEPLPCAAVLMSPFGVDLERFDGQSYIEKSSKDPLNTINGIKAYAKYFCGASREKPPNILDQDLSGLPSMLIQVGEYEILLDDAIRLSECARKAGVDVTLEIWKGMWHVFQSLDAIVPEARRALEHAGVFIHAVVSSHPQHNM